ncbi:MAG TPA: AAA family ATPase [Phycisphaerae bacterium]|nr:AAA family ATPase [Phycisphaerae bacterium]
MLLRTVRIQNYKCVEDSQEFTVGPITCLVGKNESGKTALLQALYKLNAAVASESDFDFVQEYPRRLLSDYEARHKRQPDNVLTTTWHLDSKDVAALDELLGPGAYDGKPVTITKGYANQKFWSIGIAEPVVVKHLLKESGLHTEEVQLLKQAKSVAEVAQCLEKLQEPSERQSALLARIGETVPDGKVSQAAINLLSKRLPTFVYFADYQRMPGQVAINDLTTKESTDSLAFPERIFLALLNLASTSAAEIQKTGTFEHLVARLEGISNRLSQKIFEFWSQNTHLQVEFRFDQARPEDPPPFNEGYIFRTRIRNTRHGVTIAFDERSAGFVWFFSFLVWFSQLQRNYGSNLIALLDEPGLGLHAKAQSDLLRYIKEELVPNQAVIYTTHSPFMVDPDDILAVRTVEDVVQGTKLLGTKVGDKVFSTDRDTLFPLQAALGYDITQTLFVGKHCLLVEGPSDLLYLRWFSRELQSQGRTFLDPRWTITPCGGVDKIASFMALFGGSKLHVSVLADLHKGVKKKIANLKESELLKSGHVFSADMYADQDEADVEDLVGRPLFVRIVNLCYSLSRDQALPTSKPEAAPDRVAEEVQAHFRTLPPDVDVFDHYSPAQYLIEHAAQVREAVDDLEQALGRFESLFTDLNATLPRK